MNFARRLKREQTKIEQGGMPNTTPGGPRSAKSKIHKIVEAKAAKLGRATVIEYVTACNKEVGMWYRTWDPVTCKKCLKKL